ncbi:hypothetical protein HXX76_015573 [Chlamydomonas incerta]|uniref:Uncharacterized protein n=1 Tax=Chlamydomonas incerta TaxID=51695 RepID=A0A835VN80_CHLIN|nr:hypothetical protein HXX76_015573 [Chlamydomonas incerta]|eukprot:KAG2423057.1 hypothetical protein HXX76_015573 [Chlamydomonas incerta]
MGPSGESTVSDALAPSTSPDPSESTSLLTLPAHLLQQVLVLAGPGAEGAVRACRTLRDAFRSALRCPPLMAALIGGRCRHHPAGVVWAYRPQVRAALVGHRLPVPAHWSDPVPEPPPSGAADSAQLALLQALVAQEGVTFLRSPSSLLAACTRARHLLTLSWLTSVPAAGGPCAHALAAISPRAHGGEALLAAVAECRCPHLAACLLEAGVSARANDNEALIAACRPGPSPGPGPAPAPGPGPGPDWGPAKELVLGGATAGCVSGADGVGDEQQDPDADAQLSLVRLLLEHGADPRARGSLALTEAVRSGNLALAALLLQAGANPLGADSRALREAAAAPRPRPDLVQLLLAAGARADALGGAALAAVCSPPPPPPPPPPSAQGGDPGQAAAEGLVCEAGIGTEGEAAHPCGAATVGQRCRCPELRVRLQLAELLLAAGAQPTATAVTHAARWEGSRGLPLVRLLLAARAERVGAAGVSWLLADGAALQAACRSGCVELVRELLGAGAAAGSGALKAAVEGGAAARTAAIEAATAAISLAALRGGPYRVTLPDTGDSDEEAEGEEGPGAGGQGVDGAKAAERAEFEALLARVAAAAAGGEPGEVPGAAGSRGTGEGGQSEAGMGGGAGTASAAASAAGACAAGASGPRAHDAVVELLLAAGADPMAEYGQVFLAAVRAGRWRMVGAMCCVPARPQLQGVAVEVEAAAAPGDGGLPRPRPRLQVQVGMCNGLPLVDAARLGWRRVVALLLAAGAGVEPEVRQRAAAEAGGYGHGRVQQLLLG